LNANEGTVPEKLLGERVMARSAGLDANEGTVPDKLFEEKEMA